MVSFDGAQGKREITGIAEESSYGVAETSFEQGFQDAVIGPELDSDWQEVRQSNSDVVTVTYEKGVRMVKNSLAFGMQDARFLKHVLTTGSSGVADVNQGSFEEHTFTNANNISSFTLERGLRNLTPFKRTYVGCQVNRCNIDWATGGGAGGNMVRVTLDLLARNIVPATGGLSSITIPSTRQYQYKDFTLTLDGNEVIEVLAGSMVIENGLHEGRYSNKNTNDDLKSESAVQLRKVNGTLRLNYKDNTFLDLQNAGVVIAGTNTLSFSRGTDDNIIFTLVNMRLTSAPDDSNLEALNEVTLNWIADDVTVVAQDQIVSY